MSAAAPPPLLIVTGLPCAGKSTLAAALGAALRLPVIAKDPLKEALFERLGVGDRERSRTLSRAAHDLLLVVAEALLAAGSGAILEANFEPERDGPAMKALVARRPCAPRVVRVEAPAAVILERARARATERSRHPGHLDAELLGELETRLAAPPASTRPLLPDAPEGVVDAGSGPVALAPLLARLGLEAAG